MSLDKFHSLFSCLSVFLSVWLSSLSLSFSQSLFYDVVYEWSLRHLIKNILDLFGYCKNKLWHRLKNTRMTMVLYLGFSTLCQIYLFTNWISFREQVIAENCLGNSTFNGTEYDNCKKQFRDNFEFRGERFDQCNCSILEESGEEDACIDVTPLYNIENLLDLIPSNNIPLILLSYALLMILIFIFEYSISSLPPPIPMETFMLWPYFQKGRGSFLGFLYIKISHWTCTAVAYKMFLL